MKENDEDIEKKQEFLRKNILDKGYDANNFIDYITNIKGEEGKNIEHWKYDSLVIAVDNYKNIMNPNKENDNNYNNNNDNNYNNNNENNNYNNNNNDNNNNDNNNNNNNFNDIINNENINNDNNNNNFNYIINNEYINDIEVNLDKNINEEIIIENNSPNNFYKCDKLDKNKISDIEDCYATLKVIKKIDGWFFSKPSIEFEIEVKKLKLKVLRNNFDFNLLKTSLEKTFFSKIFFNVPELNNDDEITRQNFERYLNHLLFDKLIKSSDILYDFLSIDNKEEFNLKFSYYSKINFNNKLEKIKTLDGTIKKDFNIETENLYLSLKENLNTKKDLFNQLNKAFTNFYNYNDILQKQTNEIILIFSQLKNNSIKYFEGNTQIKLFSYFYNVFIEIKYFTEKINFININKLKNYCNYFSKQFDSFNDFFYYKLDVFENNYKSEYNNLIAFKEKHFKNKDINFWNIEDIKSLDKIKLINNKNYAFKYMFPEKTKTLEKTQNIYGIYLNQFINEYYNFLKINSIELIKCYSDFCTKNFVVTTKYLTNLNDMLNEVKNFSEYNIKLGVNENLNNIINNK